MVAVDLETTGLDPTREQIIEVGAVRFQGDDILDEFETVINPGRSIPHHITQLTGITDDDIVNAPPIEAILPELESFIGNDPILGHNVQFDVGFLRQTGLRLNNPTVDTYAVASTMLPSTPRYSLSALTTLFDIDIEGAHRALNDVHMTVSLYQILWGQVLELPLETLAEIVRLGQQMPWDGHLVFARALEERVSNPQKPAPQTVEVDIEEDLIETFGKHFSTSDRLSSSNSPRPIDVDQVAAAIEPGGVFESEFPGYEYRPQQVAMLKTVGDALNHAAHQIIEAPTGVGKSLAYLLPSLHYAVQNDERVVVSTHTLNLQDQIMLRDMPMLEQVLDLPFRAAVLKGRSNYLCPRRLIALRRRGPTSADEMQLLARILVWLTTNQSGDRADITLRGPVENAVWGRLSAEDEGCTTNRCATHMAGVCPFYRARRAADAAHIIVVNHALLLSDAIMEGRVLPDYRILIIDEGHHLEDATTNGLSFRTDPYTIARQLADLGSANSGLLGDLLAHAHGAIPNEYFDTLKEFVEVIIQASSFMNEHVDRLFVTLRQFLLDHMQIPRNEYAQQVRILAPLREQPAWSTVEVHWDNLSHFTAGIADAMTQLVVGLHELSEYDITDYDDLVSAFTAASRHLTQLHLRLEELVTNPDPNTIYWVEFRPDGRRISIHAAPLDVGPLVQQHIWNTRDTVILTSATLRTNNSFAYIQERLDAEDIDGMVVESPFDYQANTLLYLVNDIPEPRERSAYQRAVEDGLLDLIVATEGRTLALFTSYAQLRQTSKKIAPQLTQQGIAVFDQSDGTSRTQLLEGFVQSERAVLMGTRSFWEGVDVPGDDLSVLAIVRLPFSVPSDPLFAARSELFDDAFFEYSIPETILRFRQGFGRLIRRKDDRGVVAIFDRRLLTKGYGRHFIDALPSCTIQQGSLHDLPREAVRWLDG